MNRKSGAFKGIGNTKKNGKIANLKYRFAVIISDFCAGTV